MIRPAVYIVTNGRQGTLYTGVTSDLVQRVAQHRNGLIEGFAKRYSCKRLAWYEFHPTMPEAISREKRIKGGSRARKIALIECQNPEWRDLFEEIAQ